MKLNTFELGTALQGAMDQVMAQDPGFSIGKVTAFDSTAQYSVNWPGRSQDTMGVQQMDLGLSQHAVVGDYVNVLHDVSGGRPFAIPGSPIGTGF